MMTQKSSLLKKMSLVGIITVLCGLTVFPATSYKRFHEEEVYSFGNREGYSMGFRRGREDYGNHMKYDFKHDGAYKHADYGYRSEYGYKSEYKRGFKDGFERGYDDAFYSRGNHEPRVRYPDYRRY